MSESREEFNASVRRHHEGNGQFLVCRDPVSERLYVAPVNSQAYQAMPRVIGALHERYAKGEGGITILSGDGADRVSRVIFNHHGRRPGFEPQMACPRGVVSEETFTGQLRQMLVL